jgi:hypothetical protein
MVTAPEMTVDLPTRWATAVRVALLAAGGLVIVLVLAAAPLGLHQGRTFGPTQIQVGAAGAVLLVLGALRAPARFIARLLDRARRSGAVQVVPLTRTGRARLIAVVALAFVLRLWMAATYWPSHQMVMGMTLWDAEMARNLLQGRGWVLNWDFVNRVDRAIVERGTMVDPQDYFPVDDSKPGALTTFQQYAHTPGYSVWLATSFAVGRAHRFVFSQWMQSTLDAFACLFVFGIARRLWSNTAGLIGALFYALSPAHWYLAVQTVAAATDSFWTLLVGYGIVRAWHDLARGRSAWTGTILVALGAVGGTLMNSTALVLPFVAALWAALVGVVSRPAFADVPTPAFADGPTPASARLAKAPEARRRPVWKMTGYLLVSQALVLLLLAPWGFRNRQVYGHFTLTRETFWQLAWETLGQTPNPWGLALGKDDAPYFKWVGEHCAAPCPADRREGVTRQYLLSSVVTSRAFPGHVLRLVTLRLPGLVYVSRLPADQPYPGSDVVARAARAVLAALNSLALLLWPSALLGLLLVTFRGGDSGVAAWLGLAPTLFVVAFSLLFFVEHRKTTPAYGYLLALSGVAVSAMVEHGAKDH